jgi:hypothetical protein
VQGEREREREREKERREEKDTEIYLGGEIIIHYR